MSNLNNLITEITSNLNEMSGAELATAYNKLAAELGLKEIKKFTNKAKGIERVQALLDSANQKVEVETPKQPKAKTPKTPEPSRKDKATWITIVTTDEAGVETEDGPKSMTEVGNAKCLKVASKIKVYAWGKTPSDAQKRTLDRYGDKVVYLEKTDILDKELVASWKL